MRCILAVLVCVLLSAAHGVDPTQDHDPQLQTLLTSLRNSLHYMASPLNSKESKPLIDPNRISIGEASIIHKLYWTLKSLLDESITNPDQLKSLMTDGLQCSREKQVLQQELMRRIGITLCSEIEWYKLVALTAPHVSTIVDVGSNKGLLSSLFLSLWAPTSSLRITPREVLQIEVSKGYVSMEEKGSLPKVGHCNNGHNEGIPLSCVEPSYRGKDGACIRPPSSPPISLFSFDGSTAVARMTNSVIEEFRTNGAKLTEGNSLKIGEIAPGVLWEHHQLALSNAEFTANFTMQDINPKKPLSKKEIKASSGYEGL